MTTLIESCRVGPPSGAAADHSLALTWLDMFWLHFHPTRRLLFYEFPCSKPHFSDNLVPKLKHSLALALQHYFPLAGNLIFPSDTAENKPVIRYAAGDSVPLEIFESADDFDILVGNQPRDADEFYKYVPQLPAIVSDEFGQKLLKVLSLQVTLFPGRGICIGIANHHSVGDASSIGSFIRAWASICKLGPAEESREYSVPVLDRGLIKDPLGQDSFLWNQMKQIPLNLLPFPVPTKRVRATYVINQAQIKKLKHMVMAEFRGFAHPSSFVVTSAYLWTCVSKSLAAGEGEEERMDDDDVVEFFAFPADMRARTDPPLPETYFGNCLMAGITRARHGDLVGPNAFLIAARAIADEVKKVVVDKNRVLDGVKGMIKEIESIDGKRLFSVSGSAKVDLYGSDFGLGRARKVEALTIDLEKYSVSLCKPRDCEGGLEIGLSMPKAKLDVFARLFHDGLEGF